MKGLASFVLNTTFLKEILCTIFSFCSPSLTPATILPEEPSGAAWSHSDVLVLSHFNLLYFFLTACGHSYFATTSTSNQVIVSSHIHINVSEEKKLRQFEQPAALSLPEGSVWAVASLGSVTAKERGCLAAALSTMCHVQEPSWRGSLRTNSKHKMC